MAKQAFPMQYKNGNHTPGMTLREYVATQVLSGFAADPNIQASYGRTSDTPVCDIALAAVVWADALIEALKVQPK